MHTNFGGNREGVGNTIMTSSGGSGLNTSARGQFNQFINTPQNKYLPKGTQRTFHISKEDFNSTSSGQHQQPIN